MSDFEQLQPKDEFNAELESNVHPADWQNPTPDGRYNLVVIGAGTAGLVSAAGAAGLGAKVALIERELMGGDCLNVGCVPSKALISAARAAAAVRGAAEFGVNVPPGAQVNFERVMQRMRRLRAEISPNDSAARFRDLGIDVYLGDGRFAGADTVEVAGQTLGFSRAVIATGGRAAPLPIPGLDEAGCLTNETVFSLTQLPRRLAVIGGGPIGCELGQCFARFGSQVTLLDKHDQLLPKEDTDAAQVVLRSFQRDGIDVRLNSRPVRVENNGNERVVNFETEGQVDQICVDEILLGIGRRPNVNGLGLEEAGVEFDAEQGVLVNDKLQTSNRKIFAAGDVCSQFKFTHAADFMARIVIQNALFVGRVKASSLTIPWCTYTSPELAHVGLTKHEAEEQGVAIDTFTQDFADVDRAILENETDGFVNIHVSKGTDRIVGATIVGANAGDMICQVALAMTHGLGLKKIASTIHPYPTQAEAIRKAGDQYNKTRLTPTVKSLFSKWMAWRR